MRRKLVPLAVLAAALAGAPAAHAHGPVHHGDLRAALPDDLVLQPVAQAEMATVRGTSLRRDHRLPETWCGTERTTDDVDNAVHPPDAHVIKVVYAYAADQPNRFAQLDDRLQANVSVLGRYLAAQSGGEKTLRWDMGTSCGAQYADIQVVQLPKTRAEYMNSAGRPSFVAVANDVEAIVEPQQPGPRDWAVYADAFYVAGGAAGAAYRYQTDAPEGTAPNSGRLVSATFGPPALPSDTAYAWPGVVMHEIGHNLGAVYETGPPNTSGKGHCVDEYDVMCYADGTERPLTHPCPMIGGVVTDTFDCGGNDYFNPAPPAGSYLATRWNVFRSLHLGTCDELAEACALATNTTPAAPTGWLTSPYTVELSGADGATEATEWQWQVDGGPVQGSRTATVASEGEHTLRTRVRAGANWSPWRSETVRVDLSAPTVTLDCVAAGDGTHRCLAHATDAAAGVTALRLVRDGAESDVADGAEVVVTGPARVAARATDAAGRSATTEERELAGPPERRIEALPDPPPPTTILPPPPLPRQVTALLRDARGRTVATARVEVAAGRAALSLAPRRLRTGTWRLRACSGAACATRTVRLERARTPRALRTSLPAAATATFALQRRTRGRWRTVALARLAVPAVDR